ncbi:MAG: mltG [Francisellaceae bacterium]|nr:mltG [Francisellaceae bacterium]
MKGIGVNLKKTLSLIFFIGFICLSLIGFQYLRFVANPLKNIHSEYTFEILPKSSIRKIAFSLYHQKIIDHPYFFILYAKLKNLSHQLKAGEYFLKPNMSLKEFLEEVVNAKVIQYSLTLVEGWNLNQVLNAVNSHPKLKHQTTPLTESQLMNLLDMDIKIENLEGLFFPETYYFPKGFSDVEFLKRAQNLLIQKLFSAWQTRAPNLPFKTPYQALILASIIEKESGLVDEYEQIAGVYVRRLQKGMVLQADPTIIYGLKIPIETKLNTEHLKIISAYNTYLNKGLPPTPIALASFKAIHAALHPAPGDTIYFVANGVGGHYFSKTLDEHNKSVILYRNSLLKNVKP